jgi:NADH-quinone oxidoreductase subunit L
MTIPLILLAIAAATAGLLNLPYSGLRFLHDWLAPVFGSSLVSYHLSSAEKVLLPATDAVVALLGVLFAWRLWRNHSQRRELEPAVLFRGWYIDTLYDKTFARGGTALAKFTDHVIDPTVIDGAVGGVAWLFRWVGGLGKKVQSGLVRSYLLIMVAGIVVVVVYVLVSAAR